MKLIFRVLSFVGLGLTIVPSFFVLAGALDDATYKQLMLIGTVTWLVTAPFWIFKSEKSI